MCIVRVSLLRSLSLSLYIYIYIHLQSDDRLERETLVTTHLYFVMYIYMKFERTKDGQPLDDIFHWEKNFLCPEWDLNPCPPDYRLGMITTTLSQQPCWLHGQSGQLMGITRSSRAHVSPQLDDAGSTRTMIHRRTREKRTIYIQVKKVSRANSVSLPPRRITNGFTVQALAKCT